jgi:protoporphyrinogen/coproporphyrinogen III oxidase
VTHVTGEQAAKAVDTTRRLVVVGGGIAGLAAAFHAAQRGIGTVLLLEAGPTLGGKLALGEVGGVQVDLGAESILARRPEGTGLAAEAGLSSDLLHPATISAGVYSRGALRRLPSGQLMGVPGDLAALAASGLVSDEGLSRARQDEELPPTPIDGDVAIGEYVATRLGQEIVDRLVEPLLGGVYAGHANKLSLAATVPQLVPLAASGLPLSSGVRALLAKTGQATRVQEGDRFGAGAGAMGGSGAGSGSGSDSGIGAGSASASPAASAPAPPPVFAGIRGGVGRLAEAVAAAASRLGAELRTGVAVLELHRIPDASSGAGEGAGLGTEAGTGAGRWRLRLSTGESIDADAVVLAVQAPVAGRLLAASAPAAAAELSGVEYASMAIATFAFPKAALGGVEPPGSGFLVPPVEGRAVKAATFSTAKWPWLAEAAPETFVVRASLGRHGEERDLERDDSELAKAALADLADIAGLTAAPAGVHIQRWIEALPQYAVGHVDRVTRIRAALPADVAVAGAAYDGVGIPACVASARRAVEKLSDDEGSKARGHD